jgi:type I restriction enzyme S subunit
MSHRPKGWARTTLSAVVWSVSAKADPAENRNARYVGLEHIVSGESQLRGVGKASDVKSTKSKFLPGDILYGKLRPYLNKVATPDFPGICSTDILVLRPEKQIENGFVEAVLRTDRFIDFATKSSSGINLPRTSFEKIAPFEFWLAPAKEQRRIAAKLRRLLTRERKLRKQLEALPALIQQYRAAVLETACAGRLVPTEAALARKERRDYEPASVLLGRILQERRAKWEADQLAKMRAVGKQPKDDQWKEGYTEPSGPIDPPESLPKGWVWATLEQLSIVVRGASPRPAGSPKYFGGTVPWITVGELTKDSEVYLTSVKETLTEAGREVSRYVEPETLLLTNSGATLGVPKITRIGGCINDGVAALLDVGEPLRRYLYFYLVTQTPALRGIRQGVAQPNLNTEIIKAINVPLPPRAEQIRLVEDLRKRLSALNRMHEQVAGAVEQTSTHRASLFHQALSGKLTQQHKSDEPVKELLARIRIEREKRLQAPKGAKPRRKAKMKRLSPDIVQDAISHFPKDRFSFDELSAALEADYDPLKDIVFELLGEPKPTLRQVFDSKAKTMQLERIKS